MADPRHPPPWSFLVPLSFSLSLSLSLSLSASACRLSTHKACSRQVCAGLAGLRPPPPRAATFHKSIGCSLGVPNSALEWSNDSALAALLPGPYVNYGVFPEVETEHLIHVSAAEQVTSLPGCCSLCAATPGCRVYQFFDDVDPLAIPTVQRVPATEWPQGFNSGQQCYLLRGGTVGTGGGTSLPWQGTHEQQMREYADYPPSWVGGSCTSGPASTATAAVPGKLGGSGRTFCFISDQGIHMNVKLGGAPGRTARTWIKEIGLIWAESPDLKHTLVLTTRAGKRQRKGLLGRSFLGKVLLDGQHVAVPTPRRPLRSGILQLSSLGTTKVNKFDVESFSLVLEGVLDLTIRLRPAERSLQTREESHLHFNVHVNYLAASPRVNGILGQTFRRSSPEAVKALEYRVLSRLLSGPLGDKHGAEFLEGLPAEHETMGILATDARYSA